MLYWLFLFLIHFNHKLESSNEGNLNLEEYPKWLASRQACETLYTYAYIHIYIYVINILIND